MTTFEQPDAGLLVEHLLPSLVGASNSLSQEPQERSLFFGELCSALEALHGRFTVISSRPSAVQEDPRYPWLWRYVNHFLVGAQKHAVQHAKLWAFHWNINGKDHLELHVSSTNLTEAAFKAQLQAGWRAMLPLGGSSLQKTRKTWGMLVPFLEALGASAGATAEKRIERLVGILGRVDCPQGVTFVASVPGKRSPRAAKQLGKFELRELSVLTPTIGEWKAETLAEWCRDVGVDGPARIHLKWISEEHRWTRKGGWTLTTATCEALEGAGVKLECLPAEPKFTEDHHQADARWSHAKLYQLRRGRKRWILVTSANWSVAAWGTSRQAPRNFELGVLFESGWTDLEAFREPFDPPRTRPFCVESTGEENEEVGLEWGEANWDGECISFAARSTVSHTPITATVTFMGDSEQGISLAGGMAVMPWEDPARTPLAVRFLQDTAMLEVKVVDLRPPARLAETLLPEVDPVIATDLREAFLLQRYGGLAVDPERIAHRGEGCGTPAGVSPAADYSVQAWLDARTAFNVVDQWADAAAAAQCDRPLLERIRFDGKELHALYARREGAAAGLVAQELAWRLDQEA